MTYLESVEQLLRELREQRRHIDADIRDLQNIIARHRGPANDDQPPLTEVLDRSSLGKLFVSSIKNPRPGKPTQRGEGRAANVTLMQDGQIWGPAKLAKARGISTNAASNALKRLVEEGLADRLGDGQYRLKPTNGSPPGVPPAGELAPHREGRDEDVE